MPKRHKQASMPITTEDENEISDSQKRHYAKMGYKPYLSNGGKIKWLSFEQHTYEKIKYSKRKSFFSFKRIYSKKTRPSKYIHSIVRILIENWILIIVLLCILFSLFYVNEILNFLSNL